MSVVSVAASRSYDVKIESGILRRVGAEVAGITSGKVLVVTDENVAPLYLPTVLHSLAAAGLCAHSLTLPAGEVSKSAENYVNLLRYLAAQQFCRTDAVVALGGGVIGDLAGFAAATYLRGIAVIQIPTSLLAMVDSSVGGKTAVDLPEGKNLVGAFHQPSLVLCDPEVLATLPDAVFRDGCAEVIKTAILYDTALFSHLRDCGTAFDRAYVIEQCVRHKRDAVCADEFDTGARQKLNLGHTIGHAIELLSRYTVPHGQAVSVGMAVMARAFCSQAEEILSVLERFSLPTDTPFSAKELAEAARSDKKRTADGICLVLPEQIGKCSLKTVPTDTLESIIEAGKTPWI